MWSLPLGSNFDYFNPFIIQEKQCKICAATDSKNLLSYKKNQHKALLQITVKKKKKKINVTLKLTPHKIWRGWMGGPRAKVHVFSGWCMCVWGGAVSLSFKSSNVQ